MAKKGAEAKNNDSSNKPDIDLVCEGKEILLAHGVWQIRQEELYSSE